MICKIANSVYDTLSVRRLCIEGFGQTLQSGNVSSERTQYVSPGHRPGVLRFNGMHPDMGAIEDRKSFIARCQRAFECHQQETGFHPALTYQTLSGSNHADNTVRIK